MKQKTLKYILLSLLGVLSTYGIWGLAIEPYLIDREEYVAQIPDLPSSWQGKKIGLISDMQVGMPLGNTSTIRRIVKQLIEERPAAVLIAGDFLYEPGKNPTEEINKVAELVRPLTQADIPTYAVLGNHDYRMKNSKATSNDEPLATQMRQALEVIGVQVLNNEAVALELPGTGNQAEAIANQPLYLVGIGAHLPKQDKPLVALAQVPKSAPRLVMMHNPNTFDALPPSTAPLAVAGHTHGGQINLLPFGLTPVWFLLTYDEEELVHDAGWIEDYGQPGNHLYVNRGIGFSRVPLRINAPPEITIFTLQPPS
ncbi:metallophosphoesterase [Coleofasciculus sp. FACHB-1120]|uniref:metallophosphoesterase n=1 Tax=Coleofasciculus sp. FACHB-1120 TaxID=2692783 RepID=UPI00168881D2|nr:metallophosphoesterase [Coleofasciculus sp. FACHB-1120]MBD2741967.1 metallophosphoesterase [Coleofasciculus sp. FACHB-1120]